MDVEIHFEELTILHWEIVFKKIKGTYKAVTHAALVSVSVAGKCTSAVCHLPAPSAPVSATVSFISK